jgi:hypothetical protein
MRTYSAMFFRNEDTFSDVLQESGHIQRCSSGMRTSSAMFFWNEDTFSDVLQE